MRSIRVRMLAVTRSVTYQRWLDFLYGMLRMPVDTFRRSGACGSIRVRMLAVTRSVTYQRRLDFL